jgi:hypothetical protein
MRTIDFETILAQSLQITGLDRENLTPQSFRQIRDFANFRLKYAWEYDVWPDLVRTTLFPVTKNGTIYSVPIPSNGVVTNSQGTFKVDVGDVMQVTGEDPRTTGKVKEIGFSIDEQDVLVAGGVYTTSRRLIIDNAGYNEVYLTYRINCPELNGDLWTEQIYYPGQVAYWAYQSLKYFAQTSGASAGNKKGNFWKCIVEGNTVPNLGNLNNPTAGDAWEKVKIPAIFGQYIIKGIHSDWLKSEMQIEFGMAVEKEANALLDFEIQKCIVQQGIQPRMKFNKIY